LFDWENAYFTMAKLFIWGDLCGVSSAFWGMGDEIEAFSDEFPLF